MNVLELKPVQDCFDGSKIKEMRLDGVVSEPFIHYLGKMGELKYYPHFPRPFFSVNAKGVVIKGILDNDYVRVIIFDTARLEELKNHIREFES